MPSTSFAWPPQATRPTTPPAWLRYVPESVRGLVESNLPPGLARFDTWPAPNPNPTPTPNPAQNAEPPGAQFLAETFTNHAGTRPYRLYIPSGYQGEPVPLIVMLHGCSQSPEDFARGTAMNAAAERHTCIVAYPGQTPRAHAQKCWKWFSPEDQQPGTGEPALIAGITHQVMQTHAIDPRRVYAAGLSAGGAAAAIMGAAYPTIYAAIGVHSGLACGAAHDLPSALAAMRHGANPTPHPGPRPALPAIVFHGDRDTTVSPRNGADVITQFTRGHALTRHVQPTRPENGRDCTRTLYTNPQGQTVAEQCLIHGAGHAWSGGNPAGTYADPLGPDATRDMLRFFLDHPKPL